MRILIACECSNTVRDAFLRRGHDAYSCDVQRADHPNPNWRRHVRGDVRPLLRERWDLVIAHPPCTYLSVVSGLNFASGLPPEESNLDRWILLLEGATFFRDCLDANSPRVCVENPIPNTHARRLMGPYTQIVQPWQHGHPYTKATCLWLRGLPKLLPTEVVEPTESWVGVSRGNSTDEQWSRRKWNSRGKAKSQKERSKTFDGVAAAMANQWG